MGFFDKFLGGHSTTGGDVRIRTNYEEFRKFLLQDLERLLKTDPSLQRLEEAGTGLRGLEAAGLNRTAALRKELLGAANTGASGAIIAAGQAARRGRGGAVASTAARAAAETSGARTSAIANALAGTTGAELQFLPAARGAYANFALGSSQVSPQRDLYRALLELSKVGLGAVGGVTQVQLGNQPGYLNSIANMTSSIGSFVGGIKG